ncbi:C6 zinc finger domain-containing protein [Colletotrichum asianum]
MRVPDLISTSQPDANATSRRARRRHGGTSSPPSSSASASPSPEDAPPPPVNKRRKTTTDSAGGAAYARRKRAVTACEFCRLRKTKCDNARPVCGFCRRQRATCVYGDEEEGNGGNVVRDHEEDASAVILERLDEIKHMLQSSPRGLAPTAAYPAYQPEPTASAAVPSPGHQGFDVEGASDRGETSRTLYSALRCESMLRWPVFDGLIPEEDARIESFILEFDADLDDAAAVEERMGPSSTSYGAAAGSGIRDDAFVPLCQKFLMHVHPRNPILEGRELVTYAKRAAEHGVGWDSASCLVLLACALACLTTPWLPPVEDTPFMMTVASEDVAEMPLPAIIEPEDCGVAGAYYLAASKRIGLLGPSILDIQCLFLASMYEKCRLRPLGACFYIQQASTRLQAHLLRRGRRPWRAASGREEPTQPLEQRVFWSCFKAENEILPTLGLRSSGLEDFTYPDSFPAPPSTLSSTRPAAGDYYARSPMSDDQQRAEEERSWLYYLAEISLRRTIKDTMAVLYRKGETYWLQNEPLLVRQYDEFEKEISQLHSHLPPLIQFDEHRHADNELAFYLQGRFQGWREATLRPLLYCALHAPGEVNPRVVELAQKAVDTCSAMVVKTAYHHRHGGSWFVARRAFSCAMMILAARLRDGPVRAPPNWRALVRLALRVVRRWGREARDVERMRSTLERLFNQVQARAGPEVGNLG